MDLRRFFIMDILQNTSSRKIVGLGPPGCGQAPHGAKIVCGQLVADNSAHLTDGLHTANQILLHRHNVTSYYVVRIIRNKASSDTCPAYRRGSVSAHISYLLSFFIPPTAVCCLLSISIAHGGAGCDRNQKRSERIRLLPYSSIALTRSCFMEIFFIAIPPKKVVRMNRR